MSSFSSKSGSAPATQEPPNPTTSTSTTWKPRFSSVEKELIAKLRSKSETKVKMDFPQAPTNIHVDYPLLPPFYPPIQLAGQQRIMAPAQQQLQILFRKQATDLINPTRTAVTKARSQPQNNPKRSQLPLAQAAKRIKKTSLPESTAQSSQPDRELMEPLQELKQSRTQQIPQQRKATCPLGQPEPQIHPLQSLIPKQQFALPTREQTSLAEQRRREAKKETPITFNEREMNEKEIHYSKSLLMCFLSASHTSDEAMTKTKTKSGYDYETSKHVDKFQHDPSNHSMAYHYSVPTSHKKRK
jgi:hypothetical protein